VDKNGYETTSVIKYFNTISKALKSENAMADIRFPISTDVYQHLDNKAHHYLKRTATNNISESERSNAREAIADSLTKKFNAMVKSYDSKASPKSLLLEQYRKLRGTHAIILNMNYLENPLRYYGYTIGILTTVLALGFGILTYRRRSSLVIKASQPFFLILVCVGVFIFSSSIFPLTIDDEFSSVEACSKCMAIPWLICSGWSILFSALYAKLRRINLVVSNAMAFRSMKISEKDMMGTFLLLFTANFIHMTIWNILDPVVLIRHQLSPTVSVGYRTLS